MVWGERVRNQRIQNLSYYHYTIGQWEGKTKVFFALFAKNFPAYPAQNVKYFLIISCCTVFAFGPHPVLAGPRDRAPKFSGTNCPITDTIPADSVRYAAFRFVDSVFARKGFLFQTLQPGIPTDMQAVLIRFNNAVVANKQWFLDYRNKYAATGQPLPYNERFGITADEYRRVQNLETAPPQLVAVDSQQVAILRESGFVRLKSDGDSHLLDYLLIDPAGRQILYGGDTIPFIGRTNTGSSSPYGQWQGFTWRLEKTDVASTLDAGKVTARVIEINLGLPVDREKIFLRIKYQDLKAGVTTANMELLGYIR